MKYLNGTVADSESGVSMNFFQIEFYNICRIHRICRKLFLVFWKMWSTKNSVLQIQDSIEFNSEKTKISIYESSHLLNFSAVDSVSKINIDQYFGKGLRTRMRKNVKYRNKDGKAIRYGRNNKVSQTMIHFVLLFSSIRVSFCRLLQNHSALSQQLLLYQCNDTQRFRLDFQIFRGVCVSCANTVEDTLPIKRTVTELCY